MRYDLSEVNSLYRAAILLLMIILGILAYGLNMWAWESPAELSAYDMLLKMRPVTPVRNDIVIVAIDQKTIKSLGNLPWSRSVHARIVKALQNNGTKYIVYDVFLPDPDTQHPGADRALWEAMISRRNVIMPMVYDPLRKSKWFPADYRGLIGLERFAIPEKIEYKADTAVYKSYFFIPPWADFVNASRGIGVITAPAGMKYVARDTQLAYLTQVSYPIPATLLPASLKMPKFNGQITIFQGLPLIASRAILEVDKSRIETIFGNDINFIADLKPFIDIPIDRQGRMLINYAGPAGSYPYISAIDLLNGRVDRKVLDGKIAFTGVTDMTSPMAGTIKTPYSVSPRVEVTANAVSTILNRAYIHRDWRVSLMTLLILALVLGIIYPVINRFGLGIFAFMVSLIYLVLSVLVIIVLKQALPVIPALLLILVGAVITGLFKPITTTEPGSIHPA